MVVKYDEIKNIIEDGRNNVAITVNVGLAATYWNVGRRISDDVLQNKRAAYGKEVIASLSKQLTADYGAGWSKKQLQHYLRFADIFPDIQIVSTLWRQLSWSHFKEIFYHRKLKRLVAIDLKIGKFKPAYKGQMELYLR